MTHLPSSAFIGWLERYATAAGVNSTAPVQFREPAVGDCTVVRVRANRAFGLWADHRRTCAASLSVESAERVGHANGGLQRSTSIRMECASTEGTAELVRQAWTRRGSAPATLTDDQRERARRQTDAADRGTEILVDIARLFEADNAGTAATTPAPQCAAENVNTVAVRPDRTDEALAGIRQPQPVDLRVQLRANVRDLIASEDDRVLQRGASRHLVAEATQVVPREIGAALRPGFGADAETGARWGGTLLQSGTHLRELMWHAEAAVVPPRQVASQPSSSEFQRDATARTSFVRQDLDDIV
jgi:hypothetical protein